MGLSYRSMIYIDGSAALFSAILRPDQSFFLSYGPPPPTLTQFAKSLCCFQYLSLNGKKAVIKAIFQSVVTPKHSLNVFKFCNIIVNHSSTFFRYIFFRLEELYLFLMYVSHCFNFL